MDVGEEEEKMEREGSIREDASASADNSGEGGTNDDG